MLAYFFTVDQQILTMFLMVAAGYLLYRFRVLTEHGLAELSQLLLKIVTPMVLLTSFQREFSREVFFDWVVMFLVSVLLYAVHILAARIVYRDIDAPRCAESRLAVAFPNNGFMAIPLMLALAGETGVFLGSTNIILLNILFWTYGSRTLSPGEPIRTKQILQNPGLIAVVLGLLLLFSPVKLPEPIYQAVYQIGFLNTPLAMLVLGGFLAQADLKAIFKTPAYLQLSALKLLALPCILIGLLYLLPLSREVKTVAAICSVTPTATAVSMLANVYHRDVSFASGAVVITTLISAVTIPVMMTLAKMLLQF